VRKEERRRGERTQEKGVRSKERGVRREERGDEPGDPRPHQVQRFALPLRAAPEAREERGDRREETNLGPHAARCSASPSGSIKSILSILSK
jgi:hypothetical protein